MPFLSAADNHPRWRGGNLSTASSRRSPGGFAVRVAEGENRPRLQRSAPPSTTCLANAAADIRPVSTRRRCRVKATARYGWNATRSHSISCVNRRHCGTLHQRRRYAGKPHHMVESWAPGDPVWQGTMTAIWWRCRCANSRRHPPSPPGFEVAVNVFTEARPRLRRLMPVGVKADTGEKLLCPMPEPVGDRSRSPKARKSIRRNPGGGRSHEDAERARAPSTTVR